MNICSEKFFEIKNYGASLRATGGSVAISECLVLSEAKDLIDHPKQMELPRKTRDDSSSRIATAGRAGLAMTFKQEA